MKFGAHVYLWVERWGDDTLPVLDRARELGLDCLEIGIGDDVSFTPALTRKRAESLGLQLTISPGGLWPMECDISDDDPANRQLGLQWHQRSIALASQMAAVAYAGAIYGHPGRVHRRLPPPDEFPRTAENLHLLADYASHLGVRLALEPMSHFRTHIANTPQQAIRLLDMADHPNLSILLDTYHMVTEVRDYAAAIRSAGPRLLGIHACESDRGIPGGGLVPWDAVFAALREIPRACYMILETYNSSIGDFAPRRGMFHNVCPDGDVFVRQGIAFLTQCARRAGIA